MCIFYILIINVNHAPLVRGREGEETAARSPKVQALLHWILFISTFEEIIATRKECDVASDGGSKENTNRLTNRST